ncbi:YhcB family protein [Kangiella sediminilitoris]|uniref:Z-ring associated protein G n=1 Tax=Kangiella sediminilitoris TaxID=1144748 RepID=A0A1B3BCK1_9GAMM|nr:DUF1043 family protein [Kangiella sediminilitoris]AOE50495.1 hypothetical protein KS2013_1786 [Kangiella sediminilitoris]
MSPVLIIFFVLIAGISAFLIGRWHGLKNGTKDLRKELNSKDQELEQLKSGVNQHFDETARLFSNLTEEYKTLYQHLAEGANKLSANDFKLKLSAPVGSDALPSNSNPSDVIDAEEKLAKEPLETQKNETEKESYEEVFVESNDASPEEVGQIKTDVSTDLDSPDIDIEVTPPKDWADDDMDDDYHPNDSKSKQSQFTDLSKDAVDKAKQSGIEPEQLGSQESDEESKTGTN